MVSFLMTLLFTVPLKLKLPTSGLTARFSTNQATQANENNLSTLQLLLLIIVIASLSVAVVPIEHGNFEI